MAESDANGTFKDGEVDSTRGEPAKKGDGWLDWKHVSQLTVTIIVAAVGWWAVHYFTAERDLINIRRQQQTTYLIEAYRRLEAGSNRHKDQFEPYRQQVEAALADIQLFGTREQVNLANEFARELRDNHKGSLDNLLKNIRKTLRDELNLDQFDEDVLRVRFIHEENQPTK